MYNSQEIANRIKEKAKEQGKSMRKVLMDCGLGANTITKISNGGDILTLNFARIADCLDCSVDYLLGRTDTPKIQQKEESVSEIASEQSRLLSMLEILPAEQQEDIFDFVFLKYKKYLGQKTDIYSSSPANSSETA